MKTLKNFRSVSFLLVLTFLFLAGCSRTPGNSSLRFGVPLSSISSLDDMKLGMIIVNLRDETHPIPFHAQCDFKDEDGGGPSLDDQAGEGDVEKFPIVCNIFPDFVEVVIDKPPVSANLLVQVLTIYESDSTGAMNFKYGSKQANTSSGNADVTITTASAGTSSKEGRVIGRYLETAATGPTGELQTYFAPQSGDPAMLVETEGIISGWFNIFVMDNQNLTYKVRTASGQSMTLFENVNLSSSAFDTSTSPTYRMKVSMPASYRKSRNNSGEVDALLPQDAIIGFFGPQTTFYSSYQVCYNNHQEALSEIFSDSALTVPLVWEGGSTGSGVTVPSGGVAQSTYQMYTNCDMSSGSVINFLHTALHGHMEDSVGFRSVLYTKDMTPRWMSMVRGEFNGTNAINLSWNVLSGTGIVNGANTKFDVYIKPSSNGGGGDFECQMPPPEYSYVDTVDVVSGVYTFGGVNSANYYQNQFALCPYFLTDNGEKRYLSRRAFEVHCLGGCDQADSTGRALPTADVSLGGSVDVVSAPLYGGFLQMNGDPTVSSGITTLPYNSSGIATNFAAEDEILVVVMGGRGSGCGNYQGNPIQAGQYTFTRLLNKTGTALKIQSGSFVDNLTSVNWNNPVAANHCYVQFVKVIHVNDLNVFGYTVTGRNAGSSSPFYFDYYGGGIIAIRSNGTITMNDGALFDVSAIGYSKGNSSTAHGAGPLGTSSVGTPATGGGSGGAGIAGGGGGGAGQGGSAVASTGGTAINHNGMLPMVFGAGGGSAGGSYDGGSGGGLIFISANHINNTSSATAPLFKASGENGLGGPAEGGGGGGGGSVNLFVRKISSPSSGTLHFKVSGGDGGTATNEGGGGGSGGRANVFTCQGMSSVLSPNFQFFINGGLGGTGTSNGNSGDGGYYNVNDQIHCDD
ncbi:MAG: hypothetical protein KDD61_03400 [Bdellovibrionales bacterium]|nr:hypothetical protein [Bdellovibrionales bacterium]